MNYDWFGTITSTDKGNMLDVELKFVNDYVLLELRNRGTGSTRMLLLKNIVLCDKKLANKDFAQYED